MSAEETIRDLLSAKSGGISPYHDSSLSFFRNSPWSHPGPPAGKGVGKERYGRVAFHFLTPGVFDSTLVINPRGCHQWVPPPLFYSPSLSLSLSLHVISTPHPE